MQKRRLQRAPKTTTGRVFSSNHTTAGLSFAAVLCSNTQQLQLPQPPSVAHACPATVGEMSAHPPLKHSQQVPSQSLQAPNAYSSSVNNMFKVVSQRYFSRS
jgi:hypothetical protein